MKTAGIIGGLGPETTARFYMEVVFACSKISGIRPKLLISNVALPFQIEKDLIFEARNEKNFLPFIHDSARQLERGGADFIVIPCNTVHVLIKDIRKAVKIPVLSIIEETLMFLKQENIKEIGLLATESTIKNKLFDEDLKLCKIAIKIPENLSQIKLNIIIDRLVNNKHSGEDKKELIKIITDLKVINILLACTDLQILSPKSDGIKIIDTMQILVKATVREILR